MIERKSPRDHRAVAEFGPSFTPSAGSVQLKFFLSHNPSKGDHMAGRNFLFVPGPTNVPDRVLRAMAVPMEDHRSPTFPELTRTCLSGLKPIFKTTSATPILFPSSGTG